MAGKLTRLPGKTQSALQQLACLGNIAGIPTLSLVLDAPEEEVHADLREAVRQELIQKLKGSYRFVHDRVQEATYALIPESLRAEAHLRIGRLLVAHTPQEKREEAVFEIVSQLNRGKALIASNAEREESGRAQPDRRQARQGVDSLWRRSHLSCHGCGPLVRGLLGAAA